MRLLFVEALKFNKFFSIMSHAISNFVVEIVQRDWKKHFYGLLKYPQLKTINILFCRIWSK